MQSHLYAGSTLIGQSMLHREDMLDAFRRTVDRRATLPAQTEILVGEPEAMGYGAMQDELGALMHGEDEWTTVRLPKPVAAVGAWVQAKLEPVIPDAVDGGEEPFIKPFMVAMADDHYALDIRRARELLGWEPRHRLADWLQRMVESLKKDPAAWYERNGITPRRGSAMPTSWGVTRTNCAPATRHAAKPNWVPTGGRILSTCAWPPGSSRSRR